MLADGGGIAGLGQDHAHSHLGGEVAIVAGDPRVPFVGLVVILALLLDPTQFEVGVGQAGIALDQVEKIALGQVELAGFARQHAEGVQRVGVLGILVEQDGELAACPVQLAGVDQQPSIIHP